MINKTEQKELQCYKIPSMTSWPLWPLFAINLRQDDKTKERQDNNGGGKTWVHELYTLLCATKKLINIKVRKPLFVALKCTF